MSGEIKKRKNEVGLAVFLITLGLLLILTTLIKWDLAGVIFLPCLGLSFIVWSLVSKEPGLLIPGQILLSIGTAVILVSKVFVGATPYQIVAINLLSIGSGWILMAIIAKLFLKSNMNWGYIPGIIIVAIGSIFLLPQPILSNVLNVLSLFSGLFRYLLPVALIILGIYIVIKVLRNKE